MDVGIMKPRILVLTKLFWPEGGGAELATYLIVRDILSKHFDITIISGAKSPILDVYRYAKYIYWGVLKTRYKPIEWIKLIASTHWIRKLIEDVDIVYIPSHTLIPLAIVAKIVKPSVKVILHLHNYQVLTFTSVILADREPNIATDIVVEYGEHKSLLRAFFAGFGHYLNYINRYAIRYADKVICVSRKQYEIILRYLPEIKGKTAVIYNPLPPLPQINKEFSDTPILLYTGGGSYIKGFTSFLTAATKILKRHNCGIYIVYGYEVSANDKLLLEKLSKALNGKLKPLCKLPHEKYLKLHKNAWGLLFPSISEEPLPYVIVESLLLGTVSIASRVGGVPELVEGSPAERFLFNPSDINEFIDKIEALLASSKDDIMDLSSTVRVHVRGFFNDENIEKKFISLLEFLL